jgi:hypothetical protein
LGWIISQPRSPVIIGARSVNVIVEPLPHMPYEYQDRAAQARAIARAYQWLDRLAQLAHFETIVLRRSTIGRDRGREDTQPRSRRDGDGA